MKTTTEVRTCPRCGREHSIQAHLKCQCGAPLKLYSREDKDDEFGNPIVAMWYEIEVNDGRNGTKIILGIIATATIAFLIWLLLLTIFLL